VLVLRSRRPQDHERPSRLSRVVTSLRVSRLESDSGVVNAGLEAGREAALAALRALG
jgi:hypothetical protein